MTLARRAGTVIVLETGVYFPMLDLDRPRTGRLVCFHTRAGFRRMAERSHLTQLEIRELFRKHRKTVERLANELDDEPSVSEAH